jgi:transposase
MRAYSIDLRQKIVSAYESGQGTLDEIADTFEVGRRTLARLVHHARSGQSLWPKPHGGGYPASLGGETLALLCAQVARRPDATLSELSDYLRSRSGVRLHPSTLCRALRRLGLPRKKKPGGGRARRRAARSVPPRGGDHRAAATGLHRRDGLQLSDDAPLRASAARPAGAPGGAAQAGHERHADWLLSPARLGRRALLQRLTRPGGVRRLRDVEDAVRSARARVLWLPTYSPDFSPLESCWSKVKAVVRGTEPRTAAGLDAALTQALHSVTAADVDGWFKHCGY